MPTIDDKIVAMSFESRQFEEGVSRAIDALTKLKQSLHFPDAGKELHAVSAAAKGVDLGHISKGIEEVSSRLDALRLTAIAVFAQIAHSVLAAGTNMVKAITIDPLKTGLSEYETQINAVQTIMANTAAAGTSLRDVNKALSELNDYADKTIYNFGQMTRNIGLFTAAGVDLDTAVSSIKGIANLAAVSGSNAEQASRAMYQLSQAIAAGTVKMIDWRSVVNAGMGGSVFQRALANTAVHMGTLDKKAVSFSGKMKNIKINGEKFAYSLSSEGPGKDSWLTSDVLTKTLEQLTGDMTKAQLQAEGYTESQIKAIQVQAKLAVEAATKVKTLTQLLSTTKEQLGTGWARTWQIIFGDFGEAKVLFTSLSNAIGGFVSANAQARNKVLGDWKALGGRKKLISGLKIAWEALTDVVRPIKQAFRDIFPAKTGKDLYDLTVRFKQFAKALKPSPETIENLRRTFRGLFALLDIGKQIISGIFGVFGKLFGTLGKGAPGFLSLTARIGDFLVKVDLWLKKGKYIENFFESLADVMAQPIIFFQELTQAAGKFFSGKFAKNINASGQALSKFQQVLAAISDALSNFFDRAIDVQGIFGTLAEGFVTAIQQIAPAIAKAFAGMSFEPILQIIRTGLLGALVLMFKNFLGQGSAIEQITGGFKRGIFRNIAGPMGTLQGSLTTMQNNLKAKTLKEIAIAVALLAVSMVALSLVDPKRLNSALTAITIAFAQLLGAMAILGNITKTMGFVKIPIIAASLSLLAGAILLLSAAVIALSFLSWEELAKGLTAVGLLLGGIVLATKPLSLASRGMITAGVALIAIGVALNILAVAVRQFGSMDLMQLGKGLASLGLTLFIIATYIKLFPAGKTMMAQAAGLVVIGVALNILALAVRQLGSMDLLTLGKGLAAIGVSLAIVAGAMRLMGAGSKQTILAAGALLIISVALQGIARAIGTLGGMSVEELAKGVLTMTYALAGLVGILAIMQGTAAGAAALGIAAAGIATLAGAIILIGKTPIKALAIGLVTLAAALGLIAAVAVLLDVAAPGLLAFGAAVALVGLGLALAGAGIAAIAFGFAALAATAPVAAGVISQAFQDLTKAMVDNAKNLILGLLEIVRALAETAPLFVEAIVKILNSVIDALIQLMPKLVELANVLIEALLQVLAMNQDKIILAGINLLLALLQGIRSHISQIVTTVVDIIVNFINAIKANVGRIIAAGASLIIAFLSGIAKYYARIVSAALSIVTRFLGAIAGSVGRIVTAGGRIIINILTGIAKNLGKVIKAGTDIIVAFIVGIGNAGPRIVTAATNTIIKLMTALQQNANKMADAAFRIMIAFLNGLADTIEKREPELLRAGARIGKAIVQGIINGIGEIAGQLYSKAESMVKTVKDKLEFWKSPPDAYGKWLGQEIVLGMAEGLSDTTKAVDAAGAVSKSVIDTFNDIFQTASPSKVMFAIGRDVIRGFAQGLKSGTEEEIKGAFAGMRQELTRQEGELNRQVAAETKRRGELLKKKRQGKDLTKEENQELTRLNKTINQHNKALNAVDRAQKYLNKGIKKNKDALFEQAKAYTEILQKIEDAKTLIDELKTQYGELPEVIKESEEGKKLTGGEQLKRFREDLIKRIAAVRKYRETLLKLRALGLDDATYEMLLAQGPEGQEFADALIAGGQTAVDDIDALVAELGTEAGAFGESAARAMYGAGIKAGEGLLKGLEDKKKDIQKLMNSIADEMVERIKDRLKIKSPSEVFAEIGHLSMEGMAKGFEDSTGLVTDAVDQAAKDALTAMGQSMKDISDVVTEQLDANPVITPILDLSQVKAKQAELAALTAADAMTASVSSGYASSISASQAQAAAEADKVAAVGTNFKFEQNNYSPEALSDIEIYRQTKNQLSQIKAALALT